MELYPHERPAVSSGLLRALTWAVPLGALMWAGILYVGVRVFQ
jgi:hypothetical protein